MINMFSEQTNVEIPKGINDCIKPDPISKELWGHSEWLEKVGKIFFWILIVGGIILSISEAMITETVVKGNYYSQIETETTFKWDIFLTSIGGVAIYAFLEYCTYHILALLIGALASIVQNTKITANVTLSKAYWSAVEDQIQNTEGIEEELQTIHTPVLKTSSDIWYCTSCGTQNKATYGQCKKCGQYRT